MPWTNFPNGISLTTQTAIANGQLNATSITLTSTTATAAGTITVGTVSATGNLITAGAVSATGAITAANGSLYGGRVNIAALGSQTVTITSALYVTTALIAPISGLVELVLLQGATGSITRSVRIVGGTDSTGTAITTLTIGSATSTANTVYTTIGGTVIAQGSEFVITSAVTATVNTALLTVNFIPNA